jgi:DNA polymerase III subunit chi
MTDIAFHFNAPAKLAYACRLLRKAASAGSSVAVIGDEPMMDKLDELLWSFSALDFIPHGKVQSLHQHQLDHTPIWLCADAQQGQGRQVLVNLTQSLPQGFEGFERVIEVVSMEDADRASARKRWKQYTEFGYQIVRHDLNLAS